MRSLQQVQHWPVKNAAAAVVTADGVSTIGDTERVFRLASVTKPLVAYATLVALEEGAVELDQPAGPPGSTVRHLLAHTSGVAFATPEVLAEPGARRIYSSAGFELLADFLTAQTGIEFPPISARSGFRSARQPPRSSTVPPATRAAPPSPTSRYSPPSC